MKKLLNFDFNLEPFNIYPENLFLQNYNTDEQLVQNKILCKRSLLLPTTCAWLKLYFLENFVIILIFTNLNHLGSKSKLIWSSGFVKDEDWLTAQLVEDCIGNSTVMGSNPVHACFVCLFVCVRVFFQAFFSQLFTFTQLLSLRTNVLHAGSTITLNLSSAVHWILDILYILFPSILEDSRRRFLIKDMSVATNCLTYSLWRAPGRNTY